MVVKFVISKLSMERQPSKFGEFICHTKVALACLKFKFHKILFTGYLVMAYLWILNQIKGNKSCTTDTLQALACHDKTKLLCFVKFHSLVT